MRHKRWKYTGISGCVACNMTKPLFITVVIFYKFIVNLVLAGNSTSAGQPCNKISEIIYDKEDCAAYFICGIDKTWSRESCNFPLLFSETEKRCEDFINVSCGERFEPRSPCMYTGGSKDGCSYIPERTICQCVNTMDLNFDMCFGLTDGFYTWPSRKLSKYYIHCLVGRTLPMECEGSPVVFDFQERHCSLVYDKVSRMYTNTVPLADSVLVPEPPLDVDGAGTQLVQDKHVPLPQTTPALVFNSLTLSDGGNSIGKPFSQTIYAVLSGGDVTQRNFVPNGSFLIQQPSSVVVTNIKRSQREASLSVLQSSMADSAQAISADMTQAQFVPERYTLLQLRESTIILKPSSSLVFDVFKSTSEIDPGGVSSFITNYVIASTLEASFPISKTFIPYSLLLRMASLYTSIYIQNRYSSDNVRTTPNRMNKIFTSAGRVTVSSLNSPFKKHYYFVDSSTWIVNSENMADFSLCEEVSTPLIDQYHESISSKFSEMNTVDYETYLSVGRISLSEIIFPSEFERNSIAVKTFFIERQGTSYPLFEIHGPLKANFIELPHETFYLSKHLSYSDLGWSLNEADTRHVRYLELSEQIRGYFDIIPSKNKQLSYTSANDPLSTANKNTYFSRTHSAEIDDNTVTLTGTFLTTTETDFVRMSVRYLSRVHVFSSEASANSGIFRPDDLDLFMPSDLTHTEIGFLAYNTGYEHGLNTMISIRLSDTEIRVSDQFRRKHLSQPPKSSNRNIFSISTNMSIIITPSQILTSQMNLLPRAIFESTVPDYQSSVISEVSNQELGVLLMKATNHKNMKSKMVPSFHTKNISEGLSSLDQFGFSYINFSPKFEHPKTTFSKMVLVAQFISTIRMPITITEYIQHTMAEPASKSAPFSMKPTEESKQKLNTDEVIKVSSKPFIFPSKTMLKLRELVTSELIQSSFIPVTLETFQALLQESGTPAMDTYSLLRISETLNSAMRLHHSSSQRVTFEADGPSDGLVLKSSHGSMPFTSDSQLTPSRMLERKSPYQAIALSSLMVSTFNALVKVNKSNASCVNTLTDMISSSVEDTSVFQSTESNKSNRTDNSTKLILSTKNENPSLNLTNTSFISALVGSCAGFVVIVILTTILIICLRKRIEKKQELQIG